MLLPSPTDLVSVLTRTQNAAPLPSLNCLQRSALVYTTHISVKQSPFQLAASVLATVVSILATWRFAFSTTERLLPKIACCVNYLKSNKYIGAAIRQASTKFSRRGTDVEMNSGTSSSRDLTATHDDYVSLN